jgi:CRP/FNR family transcriptional regulator
MCISVAILCILQTTAKVTWSRMRTDKKCVDCDQCNRKLPLFSSLSEEELEILNKDRYSVRFHEREVILKQGTKADYLISLIDGFARMYIEDHHERKLVLDFLVPWQLVGGPEAYSNGKHKYSVVAVQETLVCFLDVQNFKKVLAMNSVFAEKVLSYCSVNYLATLDRMVGLSHKQMHGRIADALIYLSGKIYKSDTIGPEISRQDMADFSSMTKDSAIRILKEFERDKIINLVGRKIEVIDTERLEDISSKG